VFIGLLRGFRYNPSTESEWFGHVPIGWDCDRLEAALVMATLLWFYVGAGLFLIGISLPLLLQKIPPNRFYGFRLNPALEDPRIWYATNTHSAKRLMLAAASAIVAAIGLYFVPAISLDVYAIGCLVVFAIALCVGLFQSVRYMRAMADLETLESRG
jgi:hypothetical protein